MNASLLAHLVREIRDDVAGRPLGTPSWFAPVLAIPVYGRGHLVAILESPGPFCYVVGDSPFEGAQAPARMRMLAGATVADVRLEDARVLRIDAVTREGDDVSLLIAVFGSAGSASLMRGSSTVETIGKGRAVQMDAAGTSSAAGGAEAGPPRPRTRGGEATGPAAATVPFHLVVHGSLGGAAPASSARTDEEGAQVFGPFDSAREACASLGARVLQSAHATILLRITRPLRRRVDSLAKLAVNLEEDIARAAQHAEVRREAETLAAFQTRVPAGAASVELPDVYDASRVCTIALDPAESLHVQIEKRFRRAAKLERSAEHAMRRLKLVRREHQDLAASLAVLEGTRSFNEALRTIEAIRAKFDITIDDAPRAQGAPKKKREAEKTYRTFDVDPRWFVLVGRSNFENDEITFQVAKPTDYWFHAQGVPGSHVVLRPRGGNDGPPARVIERTASIAAYFSKAKHSSLVPVIYTQRKYVRKFRGARPGQVTCEREKLVMVPPLVPEGADSG
ncbi:MAG: NFACT RNA binding domain-containing protein [Candidatus Latescibacteria bacterium]|nr:NFACT RNA binding domain-containing protein [Candidatus Latescibacterota bacterium]